MKVLVYTFMLTFFSSALLAQSNEQNALPEEIEEFYQKSNIVKAFSSHEERSLLTRLIDENKALPEDLDENRLRYIAKLIRDIQLQSSQRNTMPNSFQQSAWKLQSSDLLQVQSWVYQDDVLTVKIKKYSLPVDVNIRLVSHFGDYQKDNFSPLIESLQDQLPILSTSIHTWRNINGVWIKDSVEKVFLE